MHGIVLRAREYQDNKKLVEIFSREEGVSCCLLSFRRGCQAWGAPLSEVEFIVRKGRSDLQIVVDGHVIDEHLYLRGSYQWLETAGELLQSILASQPKGIAAPLLYDLLKGSLRQIPQFEDLSVLRASFKLKLLIHEGVLAIAERCSVCGDGRASYLDRGQSVCLEHRTQEALSFTAEEWGLLQLLGEAKRFSEMRHLRCDPVFSASVAKLFDEKFKR